jgi:hypothetical protein
MLNDFRSQRGQGIPFWVLSVITSLVLSLFVMNYTNTVRWHIRAQNAADSAAIAAIAGDAGLMNQRTLAEYAAAYDEYRLRSIIYSMINAANAVGADTTQSTSGNVTKTCNPSIAADDTGIDCDNAYDQEPMFYDQALQQYALASKELENLITPSPPPYASPVPTGAPTMPPVPRGSMAGAAFSLVQSGNYCWDKPNSPSSNPGVFDCAFYYQPDISHTGLGSTEVVTIVACRNVTQQSPLFFNGPSQFKAVGYASATLQPITEQLNPGTAIDSTASPAPTPYAPAEKCLPMNGTPAGTCNNNTGWMGSGSYTVDYTGFTVQATFYVPVLTKPPASPPIPSCEQG